MKAAVFVSPGRIELDRWSRTGSRLTRSRKRMSFSCSSGLVYSR
jgi:hypothetical protein